MSSSTPSKRLLIFCDGTWCGRETGTSSNIRILADMVGQVQFPSPTATPSQSDSTTTVFPLITSQSNVIAGYQEGVGLNKTFLEYLWDGATASTIGEECTSAYKFIVDNYDDDTEIYMFGFSRGAYTVRCVAGMINNCGIIRRPSDLSNADIQTLCREVYRTYRSPLDIDHPKSDKRKKLKEDGSKVWQAKRPVRLMCISDTVGALGVPRLNAGVGFDWPEFYDQQVSTVVQEMYHAPSLHDRLWAFQPCLAFNGPGEAEVKIHQTWFPGCHYDLGRQAFRFTRQQPLNAVEKWIGTIPALLTKTIYPNQVLADVVLRWMLTAVHTIEKHDLRSSSIILDIEKRIEGLHASIAAPEMGTSDQPTGPTGSGDIYGNVLDYAPGGSSFSAITKIGSKAVGYLNKLFPKLGDNVQDLLGIKTILGILTATQDRRIPGNAASVYAYKDAETFWSGNVGRSSSVYESARMGGRNETGGERYPSRTYESSQLWERIFGTAS